MFTGAPLVPIWTIILKMRATLCVARPLRLRPDMDRRNETSKDAPQSSPTLPHQTPTDPQQAAKRLSPMVSGNLRALRQRAGLTQEQLAECCGLAEETIRRLEAGSHVNPTADTLLRLAVALRVPID